jgi:hypothetical protein
MNVIYKTYEPDSGFDEYQAQIYNNHLKRNPQTSFKTVTAAKIKERVAFEKKDPKLIRYALREDGTPLAYIQASIDGKTTWIGYPWAFEACPKEIQEKLYQDLFAYITEQYPENEIVIGYFSTSWEIQKQFALEKGYKLNDTAYFYTLDPEKVQLEIPEGYSTKVGTLDDLDTVIALSKADPDLTNAFPSDEAREHYFKNRVLADGNLILVFKNNKLVAASAPLRGFYVGYMFRFMAILPDFEEAWKILTVTMAKHCIDLGWTEKIMITSFEKWSIIEPQIQALQAELFDTQVQYKLEKE